MRPLELPDLLYQASGQHQQRTAVSRAPLYVVPTTMPCLLKRIVHMPCLLDAYWMPNTRLPHVAYFAVQGCSDLTCSSEQVLPVLYTPGTARTSGTDLDLCTVYLKLGSENAYCTSVQTNRAKDRGRCRGTCWSEQVPGPLYRIPSMCLQYISPDKQSQHQGAHPVSRRSLASHSCDHPPPL